jgi:hypothetical protein
MSNQSEAASILCKPIGKALTNIRALGELQLCRNVICTSVNTTWRITSLIQDFVERADPTPTLLDTNILLIQNSEMQLASSFTFNLVQLYSTCNWGD